MDKNLKGMRTGEALEKYVTKLERLNIEQKRLLDQTERVMADMQRLYASTVELAAKSENLNDLTTDLKHFESLINIKYGNSELKIMDLDKECD